MTRSGEAPAPRILHKSKSAVIMYSHFVREVPGPQFRGFDC